MTVLIMIYTFFVLRFEVLKRPAEFLDRGGSFGSENGIGRDIDGSKNKACKKFERCLFT